MAISQITRLDTRDIIGFADDLASFYALGTRMLEKIQTYGQAAAAVQANTATERQATYAQVVETLITPDDITRIAALVEPLTTITTALAADYADFVNP